jgi:hypothetical protein
MRQIWITKIGPPEVLQVKEAPDRSPKPAKSGFASRQAGLISLTLWAAWVFIPTCPPSRSCLVMRSAATSMLLVRVLHRIGLAAMF